MTKEYETNIYEVRATVNIMIVASNPEHAKERLNVLLKDRITQYVHPDDTPPKFKVVGVVRDHHVLGDPKRKVIVEKYLGK
jgi:hypothetical protein